MSTTITSDLLLTTATVTVRDVYCDGRCREQSGEEHASSTHLVFPYRGVFVRHLGRDQAVAEANQVLFFNGGDGYRVSHPVAGGDMSLDLVVADPLLRELSPTSYLRTGSTLAFRQQRLRIDPRAQLLMALLRHSLHRGVADALEAESLALTLVQRALGPRTSHQAAASAGRQRLVDRTKLVLASDLSRRWTLSEIAAEVGGSPVYLTQVFQQVEGLPLYRYQLRLRLARALDLLGDYDDLTALGLDLGFSSHSHFTAAFRELYGRTPSEFRAATRSRVVTVPER
jgi:AraC family transcriptional regulator